MLATPAAATARKGTSSTRASRSRSCSTRGRSRWLSTLVSPWPGKCLAQAATPSLWRPRDEGHRVPRDLAGIAREAAIPDHRIRRVGVDVDDRSEVEIDAQVGELASERAAQGLGCRPASRARPGGASAATRSRARAAAGRARPPDRWPRRAARPPARGRAARPPARAAARARRRCGRRARRPRRARRRSARRDPSGSSLPANPANRS